MEIWDGYFRDRTPANVELIRGEKLKKGIYHRVYEVLVRHIDGDYLLMNVTYKNLIMVVTLKLQ